MTLPLRGDLREVPSSTTTSTLAREFSVLFALEWKLARRLAPVRVAMALIPVALMVFLQPAMNFLVDYVPVDGVATGTHLRGIDFSASGLTIILCYVNLQFFCWSAYDEHGFSTWDRHRAIPARPTIVLAAKVSFMWCYLVAMFVCSYLAGLTLGMDIRGSTVGWFIAAAVTSATAAVYGLMLYVLLPTGNTFIIVSHAGSLIMAGFAGGIVPSRFLPSWMQSLATYIPQSWAVRAFNTVSLTSGGVLAIAPELLVLGGFGITFLSVAAWRFDPESLKRPLSE